MPTFPQADGSPPNAHVGSSNTSNTNSNNASSSTRSLSTTDTSSSSHTHYHYPDHQQQHHHYQPYSSHQQLHQQHGTGLSGSGVSWSSLATSTGHVGIPMDDDLQPMHGSLPSYGQQYQHQQAMHYQRHLQQEHQRRRDPEWGSYSPPLSSTKVPSTATPPYQSHAGMHNKRVGHVTVPATSFQRLPSTDHIMSSPTSSQTFLVHPPPPSLQANTMYYHDQHQHPPPSQQESQLARNVQQHQRHSYAKPYPDTHVSTSLYRTDDGASTTNPSQGGKARLTDLGLSNSSHQRTAQPSATNNSSSIDTTMAGGGIGTKGSRSFTEEETGTEETSNTESSNAPPTTLPIAPESYSPPSSSVTTASLVSSNSINNNIAGVPASVTPRTGVPLAPGRHPGVGIASLAPSSSSPSRSPVSPVLLQKSSSLRSARPGGKSSNSTTTPATAATLASSALPKGDAVSSTAAAVPSPSPHGSLSSSSATTGMTLADAGGVASGKEGGGGGVGAGSSTSGAVPIATTTASGHGEGGGATGIGIGGGSSSAFSPSSPSIQGVKPTTIPTTSSSSSAQSSTVAPPAPSHHSPSLANTMSSPTSRSAHSPRLGSGGYHHHRASYQPSQFAQGYQHFASSQGAASGYLSSGAGLSRHLSIHLPHNPTLLPPPPAMHSGTQQQQQQQQQSKAHHSTYTIDDPDAVGSSGGHPRSFTPPAFSPSSHGVQSSSHLASNVTKQGSGRNGSIGVGGHSAYSIPSSSSSLSSEGGFAPSGSSSISRASMPSVPSTSQKYSQSSPAQRQHATAQTKQQHHQSYVPPPVSYQYLSAFGPGFKHAAPASGYQNLPRTHRRSIQPLTLEQQQPKGGAFRYVRTQADLWPQKGSQKYRSIDAHGQSISPLRALTTMLTRTYSHCSKDFCYEPSYNPRRVLTKPSKPMHNEGYDNEDYDYILYVGDILGSEERQRYQILDILGQGTFGQVVKCQNLKTNAIVAVKVVKNKPAYFNQSMMEVTVLELLNERYDREDKHHILRLLDTFIHRRHLCLVFELLSVNLYELIKQNQFRGLSMSLVRVFTAQLLDALCVLNEARIIHCDLKPENVLLKNLETPAIKVIDFGSACHEQQTVYTYIQSRFYRSPEVLIGLPYSSSIDIWSVGCIAAELFLGLPLFPGSSEYNQISRIVEMLGMPPTYMLEIGKTAREYFEVVRHGSFVGRGVHGSITGTGGGQKKYRLKSMESYSREHGVIEQPSKRYFQATTLPDIIMSYPMMKKNMSQRELDKEMATRQSFISFLQGLLNLNPIERWSPHQAKMHPFITGEVFTGRFVPPSIPKKIITAENSARLEPTMPQNSHAARRASLSNVASTTTATKAPSTSKTLSSMTHTRTAGPSTATNAPSGNSSVCSTAASAASSQQGLTTSTYDSRGTTSGQVDKVARQSLRTITPSGPAHKIGENSSESSLESILTGTPSSDTYGVAGDDTGKEHHSTLSSTTTTTTQAVDAAQASGQSITGVGSSSSAPSKSLALATRSAFRDKVDQDSDDEESAEEDSEDTTESASESADSLSGGVQDDQISESGSSDGSAIEGMDELSISKTSKTSNTAALPRAGGVRINDTVDIREAEEQEEEEDDEEEEKGEDALDRLAQNIGWDDILSGSGSTSTSGATSYSQHRPRATTMGTVEVPRNMAQLAAAITPMMGAKGVGPAGLVGPTGATSEIRAGIPPSASRPVPGPSLSSSGYRLGSGGRNGGSATHDAPSEIIVEGSGDGTGNSSLATQRITMSSPMSSGSTVSVGLDRIPEQSENPSPVQNQSASQMAESSASLSARKTTTSSLSSTNASHGPSSPHTGSPAVNRRGFLVRSGSDITGTLLSINSPAGLGGANLRTRLDGSGTAERGGQSPVVGRVRAIAAEPGSPITSSSPNQPPHDNLTPLQRMQQQLRQSQPASTQYQQRKRYHFGYPQSGSSHSSLSSSDDDQEEDDEEEGEAADESDRQTEEREVVVSVKDDDHDHNTDPKPKHDVSESSQDPPRSS